MSYNRYKINMYEHKYIYNICLISAKKLKLNMALNDYILFSKEERAK